MKIIFVTRTVFLQCFSLKIITRPKKYQNIVARPVLLQNWSPVLFFARPFKRGGGGDFLKRF